MQHNFLILQYLDLKITQSSDNNCKKPIISNGLIDLIRRTMTSKNVAHISGTNSLANLEYNAKVYEKYFRHLNLKKPGRILSIGCVSFSELFDVLIPRLPQEYDEFVVCDASEKVVAWARNNYEEEKVKFIHMDIEDPNGVPLELKNRFDHLFSSYTLGVLSDLKQTLKNAYDLMTPDGDLLFLFAKHDPAFRTYQEMTNNPKWKPYLEKYADYSTTVEKEIGTKEKIIKWFELLRLKCLVVSIDDNVSFQYTKSELIEIADFLDVAKDNIPESELASYKAEYHREFLATEAVSQHLENNADIWQLALPTVTIVAKK